MVVDKINVIKGDGRSEKLDISKIQKMTQQACEGLHGICITSRNELWHTVL